MKYYKFKEIVESLPKDKNSRSSFWVKTIIRKISFVFTYIFINLGFSAWGASVFSLFIALFGCFFLSVDNSIYKLVGVILINMWLVFDCVDGNIARVKKTSSPAGDFIDAESGYYISAFIYLAIGISAYQTSSMFSEQYLYLFIIIGAIASISNILSRLIYQKYINVIPQLDNNSVIDINKKSLSYIRSRFDKELGLSGLFMPLLILSYFLKSFDYLLFFYFAFTISALIIITGYYSIKSKI